MWRVCYNFPATIRGPHYNNMANTILLVIYIKWTFTFHCCAAVSLGCSADMFWSIKWNYLFYSELKFECGGYRYITVSFNCWLSIPYVLMVLVYFEFEGNKLISFHIAGLFFGKPSNEARRILACSGTKLYTASVTDTGAIEHTETIYGNV